MNPVSLVTITTSIIMSTALITVTTHWLMAWVCLEINTLSMVPIISKPHHPRATEATTKYFLTQTLASMTILFATTMNALNTSSWEIPLTTETTTMKIITLALMMKMAAAPFHFWLPEVAQGATTLTTLVILTWQKIAPLSILMMNHNNTNMTILSLSAILSILVGGVGGLNQTQLRKLLAFSSIAHTGWILATITLAPNISTLTFLIYTMTTTPIFLTLSTSSMTTIKDMGTMWTTSPHLMLITLVVILSLAGLPPLTGFMPKWLILNKMTALNLTTEAILMAMSSLPSLYVYIRLTYVLTMTMPPHTSTMQMKWRSPHKNPPLLSTTLATMMMLLLPLSPNM
uniref:NADH-ubiquinone oxidoreductase chain 2 n=1 Tax=Protobothrops flavoviridis TaxID=88087 RepID=A0A169SDU0_PROFL|nr:NADH dehydrogenase subunit 2 [Protobothrops flavoviridis]BAU97461.1 NADH dehydrogenase subunit 2 [Protobothrops flavoviridis]BAU97474.1 NADH dehydrogenase subunit 2 [Protobothrops flavoviridis]BAU97487.1 NADH dehydrogenase subunit 2 [Protobothrops flavoviridis]BAU97513.1 NADH dehydrogenase subunit 2 [Protobothrops flavoviridis]BAU97526.1 NADH dehydrogenase subunit 2 [Protobothrops flavoviridis]